VDELIHNAMLCEPTAISETEELAKFVTLQIALMGSDGWVLASDTRAYQPAFLPIRSAAAQAQVLSETNKIVNCEEQHIIYAFSGGAFAQETGILLRRMASQADPGNRAAVLIEAVRQCARSRPNDQPDGSLIVIFQQPHIEIWTLDIGRIQPKIEPKWGWSGGGSLALIFPQLYYATLPINKLKLLAAHTILTGRACNPTVVGGLELWSGASDLAERSGEDEINRLCARSGELDDQLRIALAA
jgi:hypothetical protein